MLGKGKYGKVYHAFPISEFSKGKRYACKIIEINQEKSEKSSDGSTDKELKRQ